MSTHSSTADDPALERKSSLGSLPDRVHGITLVAKWGKAGSITLDQLDSDTSIAQVKELLQTHTRILPKRQKLVGLKAVTGKVEDATTLKELKAKSGKTTAPDGGVVHSFILMGTPEEEIFIDPADRDDLPDVRRGA